MNTVDHGEPTDNQSRNFSMKTSDEKLEAYIKDSRPIFEELLEQMVQIPSDQF